MHKLFALLFVYLILTNTTSAQLQINSPSSAGEVFKDLPDFATDVFHNPWDMDSINDLSHFILAADYNPGVSSYKTWDFSSGIASFDVIGSSGGTFYLLSPGPGPSHIEPTIGKNGQGTPIDSTKYRFLHLRIFSSVPSHFRALWHTDIGYSINSVRTDLMPIKAGWGTYTMDLESIPIFPINENRSWSETGKITGFRIELGENAATKIDWIRLTSAAEDLLAVEHSFTQSAGHTSYSLFVDDDQNPQNGHVLTLVENASATQNMTFDISALTPGSYWITGMTNGGLSSSSAGQLRVNAPPQGLILRPNKKGGRDFATEELGNPWNMEDPWDFFDSLNLTESEILHNNFVNGRQGDFYRGNGAFGDPDPYNTSFRVSAINRTALDPTIYRNWTITSWVPREQNIVTGAVMRVIWARGAESFNGEDIITPGSETPGWVQITQDMTKVSLRSILHPGPLKKHPWSGENINSAAKAKKKKKKSKKKAVRVNMCRVDIHEYSDKPPGMEDVGPPNASTEYYIDRIELRADHESNKRFAFVYSGFDSDDNSSQLSASAFYTASEISSGGNVIFENRPLNSNSNVFIWDTSSIPNGSYWVYLLISDTVNESRQQGHRITIDHSRPQDNQAPVMQIDIPQTGGVYQKTLPLRGYAIDENQVAAIEVLIDGELQKTFEPQDFDIRARTRFPKLADSSNAGFRELINIESFDIGSHAVEIIVYDVAGNTVRQNIEISRSSGTDPLEDPPAPVNEEAVSLPLVGTIPTKVKTKVNLSSGKLNFQIDNANLCKSVQLIAGKSSKKLIRSPESSSVLIDISDPKNKERIFSKALPRLGGKSASMALALHCINFAGHSTVFNVEQNRKFAQIKRKAPALPLKRYIKLLKKSLRRKSS